ncbi:MULTISPECIES: hypothetical protein [Gordonia]|uniref:hypothetical protein n=1 Tax=Gordonia sp. NB41Y TaxID=875808 RepID=UPI0002BEB2AB|nr:MULTISPECIES: hypothetical protein [Gordonia]WLP91737.1 hypothetical protein Q9K23_05665 [Gordonia sp. NB41Y]
MVDRIERNKDIIQELVESTATHVGQIASIITTAVADVAREVGEIITDGFEMREAARRAGADSATVIDAELVSDDAVDEIEPEFDEFTGAEALSEINLEAVMEAPVTPADTE